MAKYRRWLEWADVTMLRTDIMLLQLGRLYIFHISRVFFTKHITKYETFTVHFSHSREFRVLLMPGKNKPQNLLTFLVNADPGAKCEKRKKGPEIPHYTLVIFRISRPFLRVS